MPWGTQMMTFFASEATLTTGGGASNPLLPFQVHAGYVMFWALLSPCYYWREHGGMFHGPAVDMFFFWLSKFWRNNFSEDSKGHSCRMHALLPRMILCMECRTFAENTVYRVWHDSGSSEFLQEQPFQGQQRTIMQKACFAAQNDSLHGVRDHFVPGG